MRFSSLLYFYRLRLRARWVHELFALVGIAVGVALLFAAQVANTSLTGSVEQLVRATVGQADLQLGARSPRGFDERLLQRVRETPGVDVAAPLLEVRANAVGPSARRSLTMLGVDLSLAELKGPLLARLRGAPLPSDRAIGLPSPVARELGVPVGGPLRLEVGASTVEARLGTELTERQIGPLLGSPVAIGPLPYVQGLTGMRGRITRALVKSEPGRAPEVERGLRQLAGDSLDVRPADVDLAVFRQAAEPTNRSTSLFAAISALVGFLFAFNAMLLTLGQRRELVAALRIDGYPPRAVIQVVLFDALVLGVAASLCGLALGDLLSRQLFDATPGYLSFAFPVGDQRIVEWHSIAIAAAGGIGATLLAALIPLGTLLRSEPRRHEPTRRSWMTNATSPLAAVGLACLAGAMALMFAAPSAAMVGIALLVIALMLTLPALIALVLSGAGWALGNVRSAIPMISIGELRAMPTRSAALAATGALAVFGSVGIQGARDNLQEGLDRATVDLNANADVWASPSGTANAFATLPFSSRTADELRRLPDVRAVRSYRAGFLDLEQRRVWVVGPPRDAAEPVPRSQIVDGDADLATERVRGGGWAVVSESIANERDLDVGDSFRLAAPRPTTFRVAALSTNLGWAPGAIVINADDYSRAWATHAPTALQVELEPGVPPQQGRRHVAETLAAGSALTVETAAERQHRHFAASRQGLSRLDQLAALMIVAAILAIAAATGGMIWQRRTRLAALKLDGFDDLTVWGALLLESALLLGAGCLAGGVFGLLAQQLLDRALDSVTGFPVVYTIDPGIAIVSVAVVTVLTVLIAALPGYLAARVPAAAALQD